MLHIKGSSVTYFVCGLIYLGCGEDNKILMYLDYPKVKVSTNNIAYFLSQYKHIKFNTTLNIFISFKKRHLFFVTY